MSEPSANLDLTALSDALGDDDRKAVSEEAKSVEQSSPATLSPSSNSQEVPPQAHVTAPSQIAASTTPAPPATATGTEHPDPNVRNIKAMFPDLDVDTIQAVLVADGGDFERAINTLLQMSDPTYVPPPPFQRNSQQDQDEQLARSLAAQEEDRSTRQNQPFFPSSRGGGLGSIFGGTQQSPASSTPSYDPNQLNYQPRVKRTTSGGQPQLYQARQEGSSASQDSLGTNGRNPTLWPGPKEAKVWQEDINKFAESGFAKAASTFSALRQRGERAFQGVGQQPGGSAGPAGSSEQQQWSSRKASSSSVASTVSPTIGSNRGFDKDPSPVGDNELAKILARGKEDGKKPSIADRYKKVSSGSRSQSKENVNNDNDDDDEALGWDDAGRTGSKSVAPSFEPIRISDNSAAAAEETTKPKLPNAPRNAVSLMEGSTGRGLTSPQRSSAAGKSNEENGEDDEGDDLEYVANPFEDDD